MRVKDQKGWDAYAEKNSHDGYSKGVIDYSIAWAELMEGLIDGGAKLADIAKDASHKADTEGITGFMYGAAVSGLAKFWEHGEELRRWHNLDTQVDTEGEAANITGGTLNPALVSIVVPDGGSDD